MNIQKFLETVTNAAASRNYMSALVGVGTAFVFLGVIDSDTSKGIVDAAQQIMDGLGQAAGGAKKLYLIAAPIAGVWIARIAGAKATLEGRLKSITSDTNVQINGTIAAPADVAAAVPSAKVIAH